MIFNTQDSSSEKINMNPSIKVVLAVMSLALWAVPVLATIHTVPEQHPTIQAAHDASTAGDTILVAAGTYSPGPTINRQITIIGAGIDNPRTEVQGGLTFVTGADGSILEGLHFRFGTPSFLVSIASNVGPITLRRCVIDNTTTSGGTGLLFSSGLNTILENCLLLQSNNPSVNNVQLIRMDGGTDSLVIRNSVLACGHAATSGSGYAMFASLRAVVMVNSVIANVHKVFEVTSSAPVICINNIGWNVGDWSGSLSNALFGNNASNNIVPDGSDAVLLTTSPFLNFDSTYSFGTSDLHLDAVDGTPCIDAGAETVLDLLDSTRSDLGVYGGPLPFVDSGAPPYPYITSLTVPVIAPAGGSMQIQGTARIGRE